MIGVDRVLSSSRAKAAKKRMDNGVAGRRSMVAAKVQGRSAGSLSARQRASG